jgi:hypothetical protein
MIPSSVNELVGNDISCRLEKSPLLRIVTEQRLVKARVDRGIVWHSGLLGM